MPVRINGVLDANM